MHVSIVRDVALRSMLHAYLHMLHTEKILSHRDSNKEVRFREKHGIPNGVKKALMYMVQFFREGSTSGHDS